MRLLLFIRVHTKRDKGKFLENVLLPVKNEPPIDVIISFLPHKTVKAVHLLLGKIISSCSCHMIKNYLYIATLRFRSGI